MSYVTSAERLNVPCARCDRYWSNPGSRYCIDCLDCHEHWAPDTGCGDLGCNRAHKNLEGHNRA